jgi:2-amino-4-hydroxy-6-hydroxymethyldihydropteridine diphosphokinase
MLDPPTNKPTNGILLLVTHRVFLGLGTNLGDRLANLEAARRSLEPAVSLLARSPVYETAPWGYPDQPDFLNQVISCATALAPPDLLALLKSVESLVGRQPSFRYGPRQIDLDILLYDDLVYRSGDLVIPHPHLHERAFVLVPLCDLAPDLFHPVSGKRMSDLLATVDASGVTRFEPSSGE